jgi:energy-coupling factor transporter ATP-binding protein EcfA2
MKLVRIRAKNFRSIEDSNEIEISDLTCLVGKNEAGKTAILHALYGLRPFRSFSYDKVRDYPRRFLSKYDERHEDGESEVIRTWWQMDKSDIAAVEKRLGSGTVLSPEFQVHSGIGFDKTIWDIKLDEKKILEGMYDSHKLDAVERGLVKHCTRTSAAADIIRGSSQATEKHKAVLKDIEGFRDSSAICAAIDILLPRSPKFFYTSHFERMSGEISLNKLTEDKAKDRVTVNDQIFLDFLEYAGTSIDELRQSKKYEELKAQCEGASNDISDEIFEFWSQNEALSVKIDLGEGRPEDPAPFNTGTIAKIRIENQNHRASVPLSERSAGFVWFFSFLSQFKQLKKMAGNAIILLDEPGLTLHGKAQADLLRYIQERLLPTHQVIFTTHSPFMVPAERLADVRVVEDVVLRDDRGRAKVLGTKVSSDILSVDKDTLFPLQGHLGYEITQSLFIGKNTLLVEGPSDILYLQVFSQALKSRGREGLDTRWTICPTGGIDKIWSFASLFGGNKLNIAVLCDMGTGDKNKVERLRQSQILNSENVWTASDFTGKPESDVEDLIAKNLYIDVVNRTYSLEGAVKLDEAIVDAATPNSPRLVKNVESAFKTMPPDSPMFDHFSPSSWLLRNQEILEDDSQDVISTLDKFEKVFTTFNRLIK